MLKETLDLYTGEEKITLKRYIKFLVSIFKEGGNKTMAAFVAMQIFRVAFFYGLFMYFIPEISSDKLPMASVIATVVVWPLEVLLCWQFSVKCKMFIFGQLTGRP